MLRPSNLRFAFAATDFIPRALIASTIILLVSNGLSSAQLFSLQLKDVVAVANLSDANLVPRKVTAGSDASISPDGKSVAFTRYDAEGNRFIAVADSATGKWNLVKGIPGKNSYLPIWSPDGRTIYFNYFLNDNWAVARVDAGGGNFQILNNLPRQPAAYGWFPGGEALLCHDMESFFVLELGDGSKATVREIPKADNLGGLSSPSRIEVSPDGKAALFDMLVESETGANDDGPPSAVFKLDIASGKITRLSPKGYNGISPSWLPNGKEFLFSGMNAKSGVRTIYRAAIDAGTPPVPVLKNSSDPTSSR